MRRTTSALIAAGFGLSLGQAALAADLPPLRPVRAPVVVPPYDWSGCYLGGNVGYHWGNDEISTTTAAANFPPGGAVFLDGLFPVNLNPRGVIGGVQGGCNYQFDALVVGIEVDADGVGGTASRTVTVGANPVGVAAGDFMSNSTQATFLATGRGRLGVVFNRVFLFATGGAVFGTLKTTDTLGTFGGTLVSTTTTAGNRIGWTAGGGVEFALTDNWLAKVEYLYVDLGAFDAEIACVAFCGAANDTVVHHKYTDNIVRVGFNYKFGDPVYARY